MKKVFSKEHCLNISRAKKGKKLGKVNKDVRGEKNPNYGHHALKGRKIPEERRLRMVQSIRSLPKETKARINKPANSVRQEKYKDPDLKAALIAKIRKGVIENYAQHPEVKEVLRKKRLEQKHPFKDTMIETKLQTLLRQKGISFEKNKSILGITQVDIFINPNICIFADGCYWHGCRKCLSERKYTKYHGDRVFIDTKITEELKASGFAVLRFWEHEINTDLEGCWKEINSVLSIYPNPNLGLSNASQPPINVRTNGTTP